MKLRIENNSIRFRITPEEMARLSDESRLEAATQIFSVDGRSVEGEFIYALAVDTRGGPTRCQIEPSFIMLVLHPDALASLDMPGGSFVFQREAATADGIVKRFMAYVEIDKPSKRRYRPEAWLDGSG